MSPNSYPYTLTDWINQHLHLDNESCFKCGKPFKVGDRIIPKISTHSGRVTKRYHEDCWESLYIDVDALV